MNKFNAIFILLAGFLLPLSTFASPDEEVTIRVMDIDETSSDAIIKMIELPDPGPRQNHQQTRAGQDDMPGLQQKTHESEQNFHHELQMEESQETRQQHQESESERELDTGPPGNPQNGGGPAG